MKDNMVILNLLSNYIYYFMLILTFTAFIYYFILFLKGIYILLQIHHNIIDVELKSIKLLKIQCILTFIYALSMISFCVMYIIGISSDILANILVIFAILICTIVGINPKAFLSEKELSRFKK